MGKKPIKGFISSFQLPIRIIMKDHDLDRMWALYFQDESNAPDFWQQFREIILPRVPRFSKRNKKHCKYNQFFIDQIKVLSSVVYDLFKNMPNLHKVVNISEDEQCLFLEPSPNIEKLTARCIQSVFHNWLHDFDIKDLDDQDDSFRITYIQAGKKILKEHRGVANFYILRNILPFVEKEQNKESIKSFDLIVFALVLTSKAGDVPLNTLKYPPV